MSPLHRRRSHRKLKATVGLLGLMSVAAGIFFTTYGWRHENGKGFVAGIVYAGVGLVLLGVRQVIEARHAERRRKRRAERALCEPRRQGAALVAVLVLLAAAAAVVVHLQALGQSALREARRQREAAQLRVAAADALLRLATAPGGIRPEFTKSSERGPAGVVTAIERLPANVVSGLTARLELPAAGPGVTAVSACASRGASRGEVLCVAGGAGGQPPVLAWVRR